MGTGIFCWEVHDLHIRVACDTVKPDWIASANKFPINYFTSYAYDQKTKTYILNKLQKSEEGYQEWLGRLKTLAVDTLSLVVVSCNIEFSLFQLPKDAKPIAGIIHPSNKVNEKFLKGSHNFQIRKDIYGTMVLTTKPGTFVSYDLNPKEIAFLRMGEKAYERIFGLGTYPQNIVVTAKAWRFRHFCEGFDNSPGRLIKIKRNPNYTGKFISEY